MESAKLLSEQQKMDLLENETVRVLLRSKRLRDTLRDIDTAPDRQRALQAARKRPEFDDFIRALFAAVS